jgi:hypothetical protein
MVKTALKLVLCPYRLITLPELAYAAALGPDGVVDEDIKQNLDVLLDVCSNLLTKDPSGFMRPSRLSVKEYLEHRKPFDGGVGEFKLPHCHTQTALTCLHFKSLKAFADNFTDLDFSREFATVSDINEMGFPTYAITYWPRHYQEAVEEDGLRQLLIKYLAAQSGGLEKLKVLRLAQNYSSLQAKTEIIISHGLSGLDIELRKAARLGWEDHVEALIALGADLYAQNEFGDTVLHEAVDWGQARVVEILLGKAAIREPHLLNISNRSGNNPYHRALFWGDREVTQIIFNHYPSSALNVNSMSAADVALLEQAGGQATSSPFSSSKMPKVRDSDPFSSFVASAPVLAGHGRYIYDEMDHTVSDSSTTFTSGDLCEHCNLAEWLQNPSCGFYYSIIRPTESSKILLRLAASCAPFLPESL